MQRLIWWVRRDLRLADNTALMAAVTDAEQVIPVFIFDDTLLRSERVQGYRLAWLMEALHQFDAALRKHSGRLIVRSGAPAEQLVKLCKEADAAGVYFNRDYSSYAVKRDQVVELALTKHSLIVRDFKDLVIHEADEVVNKKGMQYKVYTPYRKAWSALAKPDLLPIPAQLKRLRVPENISSDPIPDPKQYDSAPQPICNPGEAEALRHLEHFIDALAHQYDTLRDLPAVAGTSMLGSYLRWGMISPRTCYTAAMDAINETKNQTHRKNVETWIGELVWREFNYQILEHSPQIVTHAFRAQYDGIEWQNNTEQFALWRQGQTGFPIVDAAMRQLNTTGWMHNRTRMIVASFLVKDLLIDWRWGERYFMRKLLDGDLANNVGNWQWVAGTGTDASPYFRIFNPTTQGDKFDPNGKYIRRWVPELEALPDKFVHQPTKMTWQEQEKHGVQVGRDYPAPIIDHEEQRKLSLAMYKAARRTNTKV